LVEIVSEPIERVWRPHARQQEFISLPDEIQEALYGGAAGGGKTELLLLLPVVRRFIEIPRWKGVLFRRTFPELEQELIPRSRDFFEPMGGKYNETKHRWTFPSGATFAFSYMERMQDAYAHKSAEYQYIAFEQLEEFEKPLYDYLVFSRRRSSIPGIKAIARSAANPGGIGTHWIRDRFVEPCREGGKILVNSVTKMKRIFIPAKGSDNPFIDPEYMTSLQELPESQRKALLDGDWYALVGQAFPEFRTVKYHEEPENALHLCAPFDIPHYWPKLLAIDWGFSAKTAALWGAVSPDYRLYIYRGYSAKKTKISQWATELKRISSTDENLKTPILDPSAWGQRGDPKTIAEQFAEHYGTDAVKADNDRVGGKVLFHDMLRWNQKTGYKPSEPFSMDKFDSLLRVRGLEVAKQYEMSYVELEPERNLPKLQIFNVSSTKELTDTIPILQLDEKKPEDIEAFDGDDFWDCLRYLCKGYESFVQESQDKDEKYQRLDKIYKHLELTQDQNAFQRSMEVLEHGNNFSGQKYSGPVRIFR
jgi:hypothetical protein